VQTHSTAAMTTKPILNVESFMLYRVLINYSLAKIIKIS
jgi:hypothetical protein